ncbi:MAG TPA: family 1 glycosylhydrolase [Acidimicrobiia bacterium]|nr:family 1 glycosylhydrolase [Acidimicrobiia bacterium]
MNRTGEALEFVGAFESTFQPHHDVDVLESTGHVERFHSDLALLSAFGIRRLRYPVRWHRVEAEPGRLDWSETDRTLGELQAWGFDPIVDLVHHTSYPAWLDEGFADPRFPDAFLRYCEAFAKRYPWIRAYTLINEPFSTLFLCGHEAVWPPYRRGIEPFTAMLCNVLPAFGRAVTMYHDLLPAAQHVYTDTCEHHTGDPGVHYVSLANDRRFFVIDAMTGRLTDSTDRPFCRDVLEAGGEDLFEIPPTTIDVLGLDYYAHSQWNFGRTVSSTPSPNPISFAALIAQYGERFGLPMMVTETNVRGHPSDRATWLKYTLEQCELARAAGWPLQGYCWFPFLDSCDWDSLLFRADGNVDPVGVYWVDEHGHRRPSTMSRAFALACAGASAATLPAYRLRPPVAHWLGGFQRHMAHWDWQEPPVEMLANGLDAEQTVFELFARDEGPDDGQEGLESVAAG